MILACSLKLFVLQQIDSNMKNKAGSLLLLVGITVMSCTVNAQGVHLGIKAGANIAKITGQSFDEQFKFAYNLGAFAELNFTDKIGIQPEVLFNQTNYRTGDAAGDVIHSNVSGKLNYLSIPVLLSIRPSKIISIQAGPQFGILLNKDNSLVDNGRNAFKSGDFSMVGGLQLNLASFKLGARYVVGLMDINDLGNEEKWKNQGFQVYAGLRIF